MESNKSIGWKAPNLSEGKQQIYSKKSNKSIK